MSNPYLMSNQEDNTISEFYSASDFQIEQEGLRRQLSYDWLTKFEVGMKSAYLDAPANTLIRQLKFDGEVNGNMLSAEEANRKYPVDLAWEEEVDEGIAQYRNMLYQEKVIESQILNSPANWLGNLAVQGLSGLVGSAGDASNLIVGMAVARQATLSAKIIAGALTGAGTNLALDPLVAYSAARDRNEYTVKDTMKSALAGAVVGGAFGALHHLGSKLHERMFRESVIENNMGMGDNTVNKLKFLEQDFHSDRPYQKPYEFNEADGLNIKDRIIYAAADEYTGDLKRDAKSFDHQKSDTHTQFMDNENKAFNSTTSSFDTSDNGKVYKAQIKTEAKILDIKYKENLSEKIRKKIEAIIPDGIKNASKKQVEALDAMLVKEGFDGYLFEGGTAENPHNAINVINDEAVNIIDETTASLDSLDKVQYAEKFVKAANLELKQKMINSNKRAIELDLSKDSIDTYRKLEQEYNAVVDDAMEFKQFVRELNTFADSPDTIKLMEKSYPEMAERLRLCIISRGLK